VDELGIEPSPRLQELERAILRHDPALDDSGTPRAAPRGSVVCVGAGLAGLLAPLCADGRELIVVEIAADADELAEGLAALERTRAELLAGGVEARTLCFTSSSAGDD